MLCLCRSAVHKPAHLDVCCTHLIRLRLSHCHGKLHYWRGAEILQTQHITIKTCLSGQPTGKVNLQTGLHRLTATRSHALQHVQVQRAAAASAVPDSTCAIEASSAAARRRRMGTTCNSKGTEQQLVHGLRVDVRPCGFCAC